MALLEEMEGEVGPSLLTAPAVGPRQQSPEPSSPTSKSLNSPTSATSKSHLVKTSGLTTEPTSSSLENGHYDTDRGVSQDTPAVPWYWRLLGYQNHKSIQEYTKRFIIEEIIKPVDKYVPGYSNVAAKLDTDPSFLIFRKFGWLHNFVLLDLQDELQVLEDDLERHCAEEYDDGDDRRLRSRQLDYRNQHSRRELISTIQKKLEQYDEMLLQTQKVQALKRPSRRSQNTVGAIINNHQKNGHSNIVRHEAEWIRRSDDLAAISLDNEHGWLNDLLEDSLAKLSRRLLYWFFRTREQETRTGKEQRFDLVDPFRIDLVLRAILTILATIELLVPLFILDRLQTNDPNQAQRMSYYQILTIFASTIIFSASCSIFTKASRQEVFAATAAYCAVQVVYLGNGLTIASAPS